MRTSLTWTTIVVLATLAGASACGGTVVIDPEPGSTGSGSSGGDPTAECASYCALRGDRCMDSSDEALCLQTCQELASPAPVCGTEIAALFDCLSSQPITCGDVPPACVDVAASYLSCAGRR